MQTSVTIDTQEFEVLLLESFRYCLGRMTYAVGDCVERLEKHWLIIQPYFQTQIQNDIRRSINLGCAGMPMDVMEWEKILQLKVSAQ